MKTLKLVLAVLISLSSIFLCQQIIAHSVANQHKKQDSAEIHHIKYGLFSINEWKRQLSVIIADEISNLNLTKANEGQLKKHVEVQLDGLIDQVEEKIRKSNKGSMKGWVKQSFINAVVDIGDIKEGIPGYADEIIQQMTKVKTEKAVKGALKTQVGKYFDRTFEEQDISELVRIMVRTGAADIEEAKLKLSEQIQANQDHIFFLAWVLIAFSVILFMMSGGRTQILPAPHYMLLLVQLVILLIAGVTTPMIDMEAKISALKFTLLDHPVSFVNQVLYFQTKSILDVFWIMITHVDLQMKIVGILMVAFSVVFPMLKMLFSLAYYYDYRRARMNSVVNFFVMKSGKWSMTDVLIVAIFMAYIGFNGIITSQFGNLSAEDQEVVILTTNGTSLQPGFYLFLTYTLLALFLSGFLTRGPKNSEISKAA